MPELWELLPAPARTLGPQELPALGGIQAFGTNVPGREFREATCLSVAAAGAGFAMPKLSCRNPESSSWGPPVLPGWAGSLPGQQG